MRLRGKITKWNDDKGFGFIRPLRGGEQVFVHIRAFSNRRRRPIGNEFVTYETGFDDRGRIRAEHVEFFGDTSTIPNQGWAVAFTIALLFLMFVGVSVFVGQLPFVVLPVYLVASAVSFQVYAHDKSAAKQNQRRTPESILHLLGLIGGWPGAFIAQQLIRHKSKKQSFQNTFWATVVLNCIGLLLLWLWQEK
jgi:uncharacterized membrane protein YsdA (DUF1294 family)/cold shock CspA family protein